MSPAIDVHPLTRERWPDLERLFGERGAYSGCWCMWWRTSRAEFARNGNAGNRRAFGRIVAGGAIPGVLAYRGDEPIGWCSVAPREAHPSLERSRTLPRVDDRPVWSIVCFYIPRHERGRGLASTLLRGALDHARRSGARIVEAYPAIPKPGGRLEAGTEAYMGPIQLFERAGFRVVRTEPRPVVRRGLRPSRD